MQTAKNFSDKDVQEEIYHLLQDSSDTFRKTAAVVEIDRNFASYMGSPGPHWHLIEIDSEQCRGLRLAALQKMAKDELILFTTTSKEPQSISEIEEGFEGFAYFSKDKGGQNVFAKFYSQTDEDEEAA